MRSVALIDCSEKPCCQLLILSVRVCMLLIGAAKEVQVLSLFLDSCFTECISKLPLFIYFDRCGNAFCATHRYAEAHSCTYDYKSEGRKIIEQNNPVVAAPKLPKI